ncbi:hypothetical protein C2E23DRAFT_821885, partial [Lenzites betulinus]
MALGASRRLAELGDILANLPETLPCPAFSENFPFVGFQVDPEDVDMVGTVSGAINRALELAFGWEARSKGTLPITERGPGVCALVEVLKLYQEACDNPESDAILLKWIDDIRAGAEEAYRLANCPFPPQGLEAAHETHGSAGSSAAMKLPSKKRKRATSEWESDDDEVH